MKMNTCYKCGRERPIERFRKNRKMKKGFLNICKDCEKIRIKANKRPYSTVYNKLFVPGRLRKYDRYYNNNFGGIVKGRKYYVDSGTLDRINTEEKAYFLGFFYADGCNDVDRRTIQIMVQEKDRALLDRFKVLFQSNRPLQYIHKKEKNTKKIGEIMLEEGYITEIDLDRALDIQSG